MRGRVLLFALGLALLAAFLTRGAGPPPNGGPGPATLPGPAVDRVAGPAPVTLPPPPDTPATGRDPFRYTDAEAPTAPAPRVVARRFPLAAPPASSAPVRLVGFVRKGGRLKAALAVAGDVVVAGIGEEAAGYAVLAIDEEAGVRLRDGAGVEITLPPS